jgi:hypothetical protein
MKIRLTDRMSENPSMTMQPATSFVFKLNARTDIYSPDGTDRQSIYLDFARKSLRPAAW